MNVLVLGASGASGRRILERTLACGHRATGFARDVAKLGVGHPGLSLAAGDVTVASTLERAVAGHDAVVWAVGGHERLRDPRRRQPGVCAVGTANLLAAMRDAGVRRLVCQSSRGVADGLQRAPLLYRHVIFPLLLRDELADKAEQERLIRASDAEWTIMRPARLTNAPGTGRYRAAPELRFWTRSHVPRADVADLIVRALEDVTLIGKTIEIST